jgi:hypothetical protein
MFIFSATQSSVNIYAPYTSADGTKHANLLDPTVREAAGVVEIADPQPPEDYSADTYYRTEQDTPPYVVFTKKSDEQIMEVMTQKYMALLEAHYDAKAQERRYDNRYTCALRAGYVGPFQAEGTAFAVWMDDCNTQCYALLQQVQDGTIPMPTFEEVLAELPELTWPV